MNDALRGYQRAVMKEASNLLENCRWVLIAACTGAGKTRMGLGTAAAYGSGHRKILWLAYQRELLDQARRELATLRDNGLISSDVFFEFDTIQSAANYRLPSGVGLIVVDEAHHLHNRTEYHRWLRRTGKRILGLSGTPRGSAEQDGWILAANLSAAQLTPEYLARPRFEVVDTRYTPNHVALSAYGEFDESTYAALDTPARNNFVADTLFRRRSALGKTLVFVHRTTHCETLTVTLRARGFRAAFVHGELDAHTRAQVLRAFSRGEIEVLVNARLASEGLDEPSIATIVMAVPTASDIRFAQMIGRGSRKTPNKSHFLVIDFHDNLGQHLHVLESEARFAGAGSNEVILPAASRPPARSPSAVALPESYLDAEKGLLEFVAASEGPSEVEIEQAVHRVAIAQNVRLNTAGDRPLEVALVAHIVEVERLTRPDIISRAEYGLGDGRVDMVQQRGSDFDVYEFSVRRVGREKAEQLIRYAPYFENLNYCSSVALFLIAVSYEGDPTPRVIEVNDWEIKFINLHWFLLGVLDRRDVGFH